MLESFIGMLQNLPWEGILLIALFITFLENIFPPAPCDSILLFAGTLVGINAIGFIPLLLASTFGSLTGFMLMFWIGWEFGEHVIEKNKLSFISAEQLKKPEDWFRRWGYMIIIANRFLSGTRAVISFFAGMSKLRPGKTILLSGLSALVWNAILIVAGMFLGENWKLADYYINLYGYILLPVIIVIIIIVVIRFVFKKKSRERSS